MAEDSIGKKRPPPVLANAQSTQVTPRTDVHNNNMNYEGIVKREQTQGNTNFPDPDDWEMPLDFDAVDQETLEKEIAIQV